MSGRLLQRTTNRTSSISEAWQQKLISECVSRPPSLTHMLSRNLPLPRYFSSTASIAQYHLPRKNPHAFSSVMGAAADAAGVPSAKLSKVDTEVDELSERFVVGWIEVDVPLESGSHKHPSLPSRTNSEQTTRRSSRERSKVSEMGTRGERRSFGSDRTSRTTTPTATHRESGGDPRMKHGRPASETTRGSDAAHQTSVGTVQNGTQGETISGLSREKQLVAITYAGDWYRLRTPDHRDQSDESESSKSKCELVEYRRLKIGGGGW